MSKDQYGFKNDSSTEMAIFKMTNQILISLNNKESASGIFCDVSKAFDTLNHEILISKLRYYGITGIAEKLITSYLSERSQRVRIGSSQTVNNTSSWAPMKYGVPQGSILGPLMFTLYTNDLPCIVNRNITPVIFADDSSFIVTNNTMKVTINDIKALIDQIQKWYNTNVLKLNYNKTAMMQFTSKRNQMEKGTASDINKDIEIVDAYKFLGVILEPSMTWEKHIDSITSKVNSLTYMIRFLRPVLSTKTIKQIYSSYVHSLITYGIIFWGNSPNSKKVFIAQKRIIRIINGISPQTSCRSAFRETGILTLYSQYILSMIMFVAKNRQLFVSNEAVHKIDTQQKVDLHVPMAKLTKLQKGVYYMGITLYNALPTHIKDITHNTGKLKLKRFLLEKSYYTIKEYMDKEK